MWRLFVLTALSLIVIGFLIFRPGLVLSWAARILYAPYSPLSGANVPSWASFYLGADVFEGPPESVRRLEEEIRTVGFVLIVIPISLAVTVALLGS